VAAWGKFVADTLPVEVAGKRQAEAIRMMDRAGWNWVYPVAASALSTAPCCARGSTLFPQSLGPPRPTPLVPLVFAIAALVLLPLSVLLLSWQTIDQQIWSHLWDTQMPRLLGNTLTLVLGVGVGVTLLGVSLAWLTSLCEFPGRRWLDWALMLPFAIPAYVLAFVFVGLLDFAGPVQTLLREWFGSGLRLPRVRSTGGVILVLVLVFYPYVYLLARTAFLAQGKGLMEAARVLGQSPWQAFWRVALPMARPAIGAGVALALMETLADFGAVSVFNFDTFTTAIYKTWYGFFSLSSAAQLASLLLLVVMLVLYGERRARRQPGEQRTAAGQGAVSPARAQGVAGDRLVRAGLCLCLRHSAAATAGVVLAARALRSG
jgi:ABC-type Fe3+ transport system permease subunit